MRAETLAFLAGHRRARLEALTDRLVATIEASNPGYRATRLVPRADLWDSCHDNIRRVLELLAAAVDGARGPGEGSEATDTAYDAARAAFAEAWDGTEPVDIGVGGSIPFIAEFAEMFPDAAILVTGVEDPDTRAHGANEGLHLAEFEKVVLAEALLLHNLGNL